VMRPKVACARPRTAQAFDVPGSHDVMRTGTVLRYPLRWPTPRNAPKGSAGASPRRTSV